MYPQQSWLLLAQNLPTETNGKTTTVLLCRKEPFFLSVQSIVCHLTINIAIPSLDIRI